MATNPNPPTRGDSWGISSLPSGPTLPCLCWNKQRHQCQGAPNHPLPLANGQVPRNTVETSQPPKSRAGSLRLVAPLGKSGEAPGLCKDLEDLPEQHPKKEAPLSLSLHAGWGSATPHLGYFQGLH